jgi:hypothetical protein
MPCTARTSGLPLAQRQANAQPAKRFRGVDVVWQPFRIPPSPYVPIPILIPSCLELI